MTEAIGMMTGAYFIGRKELLDWVNKLLQLKPAYAKVEQCCTGAVYCQILDSMAPGKVNLKKVNFKANQEYQYVENFKELQSSFKRIGISKVVDVVALTRGSYQENLEFLQWLKAYYEQNVPQNLHYDPVARREGKPHSTAVSASAAVAATPAPAPAVEAAPTAVVAPSPAVVPAPAAAPAAARAARSAPAEKKTTTTTTTAARSAATAASAASASSAASVASSASPAKTAPLRNAANTTNKRGSASASSSAAAELAELTKKYAALQLQFDRAEQERDFYFAKLRDVEIWTQTHPDPLNHAVREVQSILYATDE